MYLNATFQRQKQVFIHKIKILMNVLATLLKIKEIIF